MLSTTHHFPDILQELSTPVRVIVRYTYTCTHALHTFHLYVCLYALTLCAPTQPWPSEEHLAAYRAATAGIEPNYPVRSCVSLCTMHQAVGCLSRIATALQADVAREGLRRRAAADKHKSAPSRTGGARMPRECAQTFVCVCVCVCV
jgi:hypothetical protein